MYEGRVTEVLEKLLVTRGDISRPVGAGKLGKGAGDAGGGNPQRPLTDAAAGQPRIRLVFVNPNMSKATGRNTSRVVLKAAR